MDNQLLKRRLTGAVVLVALGVIFIPIILSGGRDEMPLFGSNIPDKPKEIVRLKSLEIPQQHKASKPAKDMEVRIPVETNVPVTQIESEKPSTTAEKSVKTKSSISRPKPKKDSAKPKAWAVQVGSFSNRANALALQKKLRKQQYPAFVEFVKKSGSGVYRVRVGPEVKRDKAEKISTALTKKLGIKGVVMSHP